MNHLVDYGVDSEEDDEGEMEMGRKSLEKSSVKGKEGKNSSPEGREGERGDGVEDAFDEGRRSNGVNTLPFPTMCPTDL